jgi:hypothetical protein
MLVDGVLMETLARKIIEGTGNAEAAPMTEIPGRKVG